MSLRNNTTILTVTESETIPGQHNWGCIFLGSYNSNAERISKLCAYCLILLGSFFGNIFIIIIVCRRRGLRKTMNYFIVNMAVSDLLFSLVVIPDQITKIVTDSWHWHVSGILGSIFCKFYIFTSSLSFLVSVQSLVWIAIDRFVAVVFPLKLGLISSKIRTTAIVSTWVLAGVFYFPPLVTWDLVELGNSTYCGSENIKSISPSKEGGAVYHWLHITIRCLAPLSVITVLYTAIAISLKRRSSALVNVAQYERQHSVKKRRQATQMAVAILVLFYICVFPYTLLRFVDFFVEPSCAFLRSFYFISISMLFLSSVVNPIVCLSFVESYRRGLRNIVCYFCGKRDDKRAKREQITLKRIRTLPDGGSQRTSKDAYHFQEIFADTVQ